jgi:hypothetical protein
VFGRSITRRDRTIGFSGQFSGHLLSSKWDKSPIAGQSLPILRCVKYRTLRSRSGYIFTSLILRDRTRMPALICRTMDSRYQSVHDNFDASVSAVCPGPDYETVAKRRELSRSATAALSRWNAKAIYFKQTISLSFGDATFANFQTPPFFPRQ